MKLKIEALDPLFFRDGRPFSMGEETYAQGIFPPLPSTVRGALRSHWMSQQLGTKEVKELAKDSDLIEISFFGLGIAGKPVFPAPLDLFFPDHRSGESVPAQAMKLVKRQDIKSSAPADIEYLFYADVNGKTESVATHLLDEEMMKNYIDGKRNNGLATKRLSDHVSKEYKTGIGRDNEVHRTKDGLLFRLVSNRFEDAPDKSLCLLLQVNQLSQAPSIGVMPLGGERRSVAVETIHEQGFNLPEQPKIKGKYIKICLLTPAFFDSWYPTLPGLKLMAACVGKPVSIGGWDVLEKKPKAMRRAAPAGSVYVFAAESEDHANQLAKKYHGQSICQYPDDREGFGLCFVAQPFDNQTI